MNDAIYILIIVVLIISIFLILLARRPNGQIVVTQGENGKKIFSLELDEDPEDIKNMKSVTFRVIKIEEIAD